MEDPLEKKIELTEEAKEAEEQVEALPKPRLRWKWLRRRGVSHPSGESEAIGPGAGEPRRRSKRKLFIIGGVFGFLVVFGIIFGLWPLLRIRGDAVQLNQEVKGIAEAVQRQDLNEAVSKLEGTQTTLQRLSRDYRQLIWLKAIPYIRWFYQDGEHIVKGGQYLLEAGDVALEALRPYADILGLEEKEESKKPEEMTTEERLILALDALDKLHPSLDQISEKLNLARQEVNQVNPNRYPVAMFGKKVRTHVSSVVKMIEGTAQVASEVKPVISYLKPLLGVPDEKKYLLLFQNNAELRPTGGFITAYAVLSVQNGKFTPLGSYDIYQLDGHFGNRLKAPEPILNYHKNVFYWHLRDMNLSPDFKVSMETFLENYQKVASLKDVDAVIALDVHFLVELLEILGTVGVGADWGEFSAEIDPRCDCPQVFYMLEWYADKPGIGPRAGRKAVLGPLMQSMLLNMMQSPRKKWPEFFNIIFTNIQEKHVLFYFFDEELQGAIEALNAGGRVKDYEGDYLHVNDCNFAGAKSNMFIQEFFTQEIEIGPDGTVTKTLVIDYKNPFPPSNCNLEAGELCLNGLYRDWLRIYVPQGSELLEASGSEIEVKVYEDLGKTVFELFYGDRSPLRPEGRTQVTVKYRLPFKVEKDHPYKILIQKQPGTYGYENTIRINGQEEIFELKTDRELSF